MILRFGANDSIGFDDQGSLFSYVDLEERIPAEHPLRKTRNLVREVLSELDEDFEQAYLHEVYPSTPLELLLSAFLSRAFYGIYSEIQLIEQLGYNVLFRRFIGPSPDDPVWVPECFSKYRVRLQEDDIFSKFMAPLPPLEMCAGMARELETAGGVGEVGSPGNHGTAASNR